MKKSLVSIAISALAGCSASLMAQPAECEYTCNTVPIDFCPFRQCLQRMCSTSTVNEFTINSSLVGCSATLLGSVVNASAWATSSGRFVYRCFQNQNEATVDNNQLCIKNRWDPNSVSVLAGPVGCQAVVTGGANGSITANSMTHSHQDGFAGTDPAPLPPDSQCTTVSGTAAGFGGGYVTSERTLQLPPCSNGGISTSISISGTWRSECNGVSSATTYRTVFYFYISGTIGSGLGSTPLNPVYGIVGLKPDGTPTLLGSTTGLNLLSDINAGAGSILANGEVGGVMGLPPEGGTVVLIAVSDNFRFDGDINRDGILDWNDRRAMVNLIGTSIGSANYNPRGDFDLDGSITLADWALYVAFFSVNAPCVADFTANGTRDTTDLFSFLSAWFAGTLVADTNGDGIRDVTDIFAFQTIWFAGCP